jgi:hypothetical protein
MYRCTVLKDHLQVNPSIKFAENEEKNNNQFYHDQTDHLNRRRMGKSFLFSQRY